MVDIQKNGAPTFPGPVFSRKNGQIIARIYPSSLYERIITLGVNAEVWMDQEINKDDLARSQAKAYKQSGITRKIALVLGAGNVAGLPVIDSLFKLFVENQVVLLKMNPVNDYLGPFIEDSHSALVESGFLRIAYGGAKEGEYLGNDITAVGSYPGNESHNIQSGIGFTNNTYMFSQPEKVVVRVPFMTWPKPIWFNSRARTFEEVSKRVAQFDLKPSLWKIPGILMAALRS